MYVSKILTGYRFFFNNYGFIWTNGFIMHLHIWFYCICRFYEINNLKMFPYWQILVFFFRKWVVFLYIDHTAKQFHVNMHGTRDTYGFPIRNETGRKPVACNRHWRPTTVPFCQFNWTRSGSRSQTMQWLILIIPCCPQNTIFTTIPSTYLYLICFSTP